MKYKPKRRDEQYDTTRQQKNLLEAMTHRAHQSGREIVDLVGSPLNTDSQKYLDGEAKFIAAARPGKYEIMHQAA